MEQISEAFVAIVDLAAVRGVKKVNEIEGCWEVQVDEQWFFAVNGHPEPTPCSKGPEVQPFHAYIEFNGWPAGIVSPGGGVIAAGEAANEGAFIEAVRSATAGVS